MCIDKSTCICHPWVNITSGVRHASRGRQVAQRARAAATRAGGGVRVVVLLQHTASTQATICHAALLVP